jgi:hypothetical protein
MGRSGVCYAQLRRAAASKRSMAWHMTVRSAIGGKVEAQRQPDRDIQSHADRAGYG